MGKVTGFLEFERERPRLRAGRGAHQALARIRAAAAGGGDARAGRALHGLRHALLPRHRPDRRAADRLPGQQPDPGLERPRLSRQLGRGRAQPALDQQFPGSHRPRLPGAVRGVLHAQHRRQPGHHQDHRMRDRRPRVRERLDQAGAGRRTRPARRSPSSARARPAWPARSSSPAPATTCIVYEKHAKAGGLLRYGIPDFKMEKGIVDLRVEQMEAEGVTFHYGAHVGVDLPAEKLLAGLRRGGADRRRRERRATCRSRAASSTASISRWISCRSRTAASAASRWATSTPILATGKHVVVIGGGDTGSDCIGTSIRQGALSVTNFEIMPKPPEQENKPLTWPLLAAEAAHLVEPRGRRRARLRGADARNSPARTAR